MSAGDWKLHVSNKQIGPFCLGTSLNEALRICKKLSDKTTEYYFDDMFKNSILCLKDQKLEFIFDGYSQMLVGITGTFLPSTVSLSNVDSLDLRKALEVFPPTKKGVFHDNIYTLTWPDINISFRLDEGRTKQLKDLADHPITADYAPLAERFWFSQPVTASSTHTAQSSTVLVTPGISGITLSSGRRLLISDHSAQDVLTELGDPDSQEGNIFRYHKLGILIEIGTRIEHIFLFTNLPTHADSFGEFDRCPWTLEIDGKNKLDFRSSWKSIEAVLGECEPPVVLPGVQVYSYASLGLKFEVSGGHVAVLHIH